MAISEEERSAPDGGAPELVVVDAAADSSLHTAATIRRAAEKNEDPEVGAILEHASASAEQTVGRIGWLRAWTHRLFANHS
jgi:hypothetical protein